MSKIPLLVASLMLPAMVWAGNGVVTRPTSLHAEPYSDAAEVSRLAQGAPIDLSERRGGWYRGRSGGASGWVRMVSVRLNERSQAGGDSGLGESLRFVSTGRSGSRSSQATTGVRGLDKRELSQATPDREALKQLDQYAVDVRGAQRFARKHHLEAQP